jgi:hypothetical protein
VISVGIAGSCSVDLNPYQSVLLFYHGENCRCLKRVNCYKDRLDIPEKNVKQLDGFLFSRQQFDQRVLLPENGKILSRYLLSAERCMLKAIRT